VHRFANSIGVPTRFISLQEAWKREPTVRAKVGVLESETTGIVDSHGLMSWLEGKILDSGGDIAFHTAVTGIEALPHGGYTIHTCSDDGTTSDPITTETLINSGGLSAIAISNMILPPGRQHKPFYAKGTYFSYSGSGPKPSTLLYPAPSPGHGGLGTHLTLDLSNPPRVRFGPDVEWVDDPTDLKPNESRLEAALDDIEKYLPGLQRDRVEVDYCGIRPKLGKGGSVVGGTGFIDFYIKEEEGFPGFVNLLGIESPGLTSSLAIGEYVEGILYR
jgi:L-2-hydroxyglutarate oxidase LhgO